MSDKINKIGVMREVEKMKDDVQFAVDLAGEISKSNPTKEQVDVLKSLLSQAEVVSGDYVINHKHSAGMPNDNYKIAPPHKHGGNGIMIHPNNLSRCKCIGEKVTMGSPQAVIENPDSISTETLLADRLETAKAEQEARRLLNAEIEMMQKDNDQLKQKVDQLMIDLDESDSEFKNAMQLVKVKNDQIAQLKAEKAELIEMLKLSASWHEVIIDYQGSPLQDKITGLLNKLQ